MVGLSKNGIGYWLVAAESRRIWNVANRAAYFINKVGEKASFQRLAVSHKRSLAVVLSRRREQMGRVTLAMPSPAL
jgi:hypothetical protein